MSYEARGRSSTFSILIRAALLVALVVLGVLVLLTLRDSEPMRHPRFPAVVQQSTNELRLDIARTPIEAPDFELEDLSERKVRLQNFRGNVVFLNFWATWCPPCVQEMPAMEQLHRELQGNGLTTLAINFQEDREQVKEFLRQRNLTFTVLLDRDGKVAERYRAWALPVSVIINKRGEIAAKAMGARDWASKKSLGLFRELLAE